MWAPRFEVVGTIWKTVSAVHSERVSCEAAVLPLGGIFRGVKTLQVLQDGIRQ